MSNMDVTEMTIDELIKEHSKNDEQSAYDLLRWLNRQSLLNSD